MTESATWRTDALGRDTQGDHNLDGNSSESKAPSTPQDISGSKNEKVGTGDIAQHQAQRKYSTWQWVSILVAIYSSQFLYGLDVTIVADIQGAVTDEFGEVGLLGWLGIGFPLGSVATILSL